MRRPILLLLTCLLALATGVALLRASILVAGPNAETSPLGPSSDAGAADAALVRRFYDAVNTTLGKGDPEPLFEVVAADFVDRAAQSGFAPTRDGLVQQLLALRATFPAIWLVVEDAHPHGDLVLARVRVEGIAHGKLLGVPIAGTPAVWAGLDVFRIAGDRIAQRLAAADWPFLPHPLAQAPLHQPPPAAFVRLGRLTFAPGASQPRTALLAPQLIAVERGILTLRVEGEAVLTRADSANTGAPPPGDVIMDAGDTLMLSSSAWYAVHNGGQTPAVVLSMALLPWSADASGTPQYLWLEAGLPNVSAQLLAEGVATDLPAGPATIAVGRVSIAARAGLEVGGGIGLRLAVVEAGALQLKTPAGLGATLAAGQGTLIPPTSDLVLRAADDAPLVVLLATITPSPPPTETDVDTRSGAALAAGPTPMSTS